MLISIVTSGGVYAQGRLLRELSNGRVVIRIGTDMIRTGWRCNPKTSQLARIAHETHHP